MIAFEYVKRMTQSVCQISQYPNHVWLPFEFNIPSINTNFTTLQAYPIIITFDKYFFSVRFVIWIPLFVCLQTYKLMFKYCMICLFTPVTGWYHDILFNIRHSRAGYFMLEKTFCALILVIYSGSTEHSESHSKK